MRARAMVLKGFNQQLILEEIEIPPLIEGETLVEITASGICGSDLHMQQGRDPRIPLPIILGHEGVGRVVEIKGKKRSVEGELLQPGDEILWNRGVSCGECFFCQVKKIPALCPERRVYGIHRSRLEPPYLNGCYADHIILSPDTDIFKLNAVVDLSVLVTASCSGATAAHCFDYLETGYGETALIQGPGPLGIFAVFFAAAAGASEIIMIGGSEQRLEAAGVFGATHTLNRHQLTAAERRDYIMDLTAGRGVDYAVEAAGEPAAVREGLNLLRPGGKYISVGFGEPNGTIEVDCFRDIVRKNISYQGVWVSDTGHTYRAIKAILREPELFSTLITHRFHLAEANIALQVMRDKTAVKAVLLPGGDPM